MNGTYSNGGLSAELRTLPFGSLNRRIYGLLTLTQILQAEFTYPQNVICNKAARS